MLNRNYNELTYEELKEEDKFERHKYIPRLVEQIESKKEDCFVMQISGQYGSGKTFFANLLRKYLEGKGVNTLYYNAWENDYANNPFISFCNIFIQKFKVDTPDKDGFKTAALNLLKNNTVPLFFFALKQIIGIDFTKYAETIATTAKDIDDNSNLHLKACNQLLQNEQNRTATIKIFREELEKLSGDKPLVVFIDDLDRCKPDFAIQLLENIKHLFCVKGITFVITVDDEQLKSTVQTFYGLKNAEGYLYKIIDHKFSLPLASYKGFITKQLNSYNINPVKSPFGEAFFSNVLNNLGFLFDLSLRDFERIFKHVHLPMKEDNGYKENPEIFYLAYIMKEYFYKFENEIKLLETEQSKKLTNDEKLVRFFNQKFSNNRYFTYSVLSNLPVAPTEDFNLQTFMMKLYKLNTENIVDYWGRTPEHCYDFIPTEFLYKNEKTILEQARAKMDNMKKAN